MKKSELFGQLAGNQIWAEYVEMITNRINEKKAELRRELKDETGYSAQTLTKRTATFIEDEVIPEAEAKLAGMEGAEDILARLDKALQVRLHIIGTSDMLDLEKKYSIDDIEREKINFYIGTINIPRQLATEFKGEEEKAELENETQEVQEMGAEAIEGNVLDRELDDA